MNQVQTCQPFSHPPLIFPAALAERIVGHKTVLLMMDYDGTLVPIAPTPEQARPGEKLLAILSQLTRKPGYTLAVLSGRRLEELRALLPVPGLYLAGVHGAVIRRPDGQIIPLVKRTGLAEVILSLSRLVRECIGNQPGFLVENKGPTLAIHYRLAGVEAAEKTLALFRQKSENLRQQYNLELLPGKAILEVRPKGFHKGNPVSWLQENFPGRFGVFLGDDTTDEDAFQHLKNGLGVLVSERPRPSGASLRLKSPGEVQRFLELLAAY